MTATDWLFKKLWDEPKDKFTWYAILKIAKEMEEGQHKDLILFMRTENKMGKSVQDILEQYYDKINHDT